MRYLKGLENYQSNCPTAVTIGKFNGLHRGHELLIGKTIEYSQAENLDSVVLVFELPPSIASKQIISNEQRRSRLSDRVDYLIECPLDAQLLKMEAETFIEQILVDKLHATRIVVGEDFHFGNQRKGDGNLLKASEKKYGFSVEVVKKICYQDREISSTFVREALETGQMELVNELLGYDYKELAES